MYDLIILIITCENFGSKLNFVQVTNVRLLRTIIVLHFNFKLLEI